MQKMPPRQQSGEAFLLCAFPIAVWSWIIFLYNLPSLLLSMRLSQIIAVFAYLQVVALLESGLLFFIILALVVLLPIRLYRNYFISQTGLIVLALSGWAVGLHYKSEQIAMGTANSEGNWLTIWSIAWLVAFFGSAISLRYFPRLEKLFSAFIDRLSVVSGVYVIIALISLPYLIFRYLLLVIL